MTNILLQIKQRKKPTSLTMFKCDDVNNNNVNVRDQHQQTEMLSALSSVVLTRSSTSGQKKKEQRRSCVSLLSLFHSEMSFCPFKSQSGTNLTCIDAKFVTGVIFLHAFAEQEGCLCTLHKSEKTLQSAAHFQKSISNFLCMKTAEQIRIMAENLKIRHSLYGKEL